MVARSLGASAAPWILLLALPACAIKLGQDSVEDVPPRSNQWRARMELVMDGEVSALQRRQQELGNLKYTAAAIFQSARPPAAIIVDTNLGFDQFDDVRNYRALESVLANHPGAEVQFLHMASEWSAMGFEYGKSLPYNILQKHAAMGYPISVVQIDGESPISSLGLGPGTPGLEWWNKYGVDLAKRRDGEYSMYDSPEVWDRTARFASRLMLLQRSLARGDAAPEVTIVSDLSLVLKEPARPGFWELPADQTTGDGAASEASGVASPALMVAGLEELGKVRCALLAFDTAALKGRRDPDKREVRACLHTKSLSSAPDLGVATVSASQELLMKVKLHVRENAPDKEFVKRWHKFSGMKPGDNPLVNPYILDNSTKVFDAGRLAGPDASGVAVNVSAQKSCPAVVVPGFPKAGTTSFYKMLMQHPMVLSQQRGPHGFSEGSHYWEPEKSHRYMWTPMIEQDEPFVWFDIGLFYGAGWRTAASEDEVMDLLKSDCLKTPSVLWLLREPVSLMISSFFFVGGESAFGSFDDYIRFVKKAEYTLPMNILYSLGRMDRVLEQPVYWKEKLKQPLHVVNIEEWSADPGPSLREAFRLMGLPEDQLGHADDIAATQVMQSERGGIKVCKSNVEWLEDHFRPRKEALQRALGRTLAGWGSSQLPKGVAAEPGC